MYHAQTRSYTGIDWGMNVKKDVPLIRRHYFIWRFFFIYFFLISTFIMAESSVETKHIPTHRDDPAPPCGCFVSKWNTPEEYDEDMAPVQCFPQAFPFTLFQARPSKRPITRPTTPTPLHVHEWACRGRNCYIFAYFLISSFSVSIDFNVAPHII